MAYYRNLIDSSIVHGYHEEHRAQHSNGIHYQQFLRDKQYLENAVSEYIRAMSTLQKQQQ